MKSESTLLLALTILVSSLATASPVEDLASPDQSLRDKAAADLRITHKSAPESRWLPVLDKIVEGLPEDGVEEALREFHATFSYAAGRMDYSEYAYRLDDEWILVCRFVDDKLTRRKLARSPKCAYIEPPKGFTGRWVIYFINGQKGEERDYKNGEKDGECITYYWDGLKQEVEHYKGGRRHGDYTVFYPSGKVSSVGRYANDKQAGTWTKFDENGVTTSTVCHPEEPAITEAVDGNPQ